VAHGCQKLVNSRLCIRKCRNRFTQFTCQGHLHEIGRQEVIREICELEAVFDRHLPAQRTGQFVSVRNLFEAQPHAAETERVAARQHARVLVRRRAHWTVRQVLQLTDSRRRHVLLRPAHGHCTEADLGMFSMFGRTWAENNHVITKYSVNVG